VTLRSSEMGSHEELYALLTFFNVPAAVCNSVVVKGRDFHRGRINNGVGGFLMGETNYHSPPPPSPGDFLPCKNSLLGEYLPVNIRP